MDPQNLIDSAHIPGVPAPIWFVQLFKAIGMALHIVPMNLWFAGLLVAMLLYAAGSPNGRRWSRRLMMQMPLIVAFGVNFGIVPLLFVQLAYNRVFYPATILMAWFWLAVIVLLIPAYYGVYYYAFAVRDERVGRWHSVIGWTAAVMFVLIGFIFANAMSLMTRVSAWPDLWQRHSVDAAATGTAMNHGDPTLLPRWLLMFGLALGTAAVWAVVDAAWFAWKEKPEYRLWAASLARKLYAVSFVWVVAVGTWYVWGAWDPEVRRAMFSGPWAVLTIATGAAPGLPLAWLWLRRDAVLGRLEATLLGLAQFGVLAINVASRQFVQTAELRPYLDIAALPTNTQWGPLVMFLLLFIAGLGLVAWMVAQVVKVERQAIS